MNERLGDEHITRAAAVEACQRVLGDDYRRTGVLENAFVVGFLAGAKYAAGALGDEHITRAARVLLEELPPTDLTIETMGEAAAHEEWRKIAARMLEAAAGDGDAPAVDGLEAAGAVGDVIPPQEIHGWGTEANVFCVVCPDCAFTFDALHVDTGGESYSCPACAELSVGVVLPVPPETK